MRALDIAIIGINGFGELHLNVAERLSKEGLVNLKAVSNRHYDNCREKVDRLAEKGVSFYQDYKEMLKKETDLDFVVVTTPLHVHKEMAVNVMSAGYNLLLEKPPAITIQDLDEIIKVSKETKKVCSVNFIYTSGKAYREMLRIIREGELGTVKNIYGMALWKRLDKYYQRSSWAGKLKINGEYVLDGAMNNPLSHLLNNMTIAAAAVENGSVSEVTAELYHAHDIEGDDVTCARIKMNNGIMLYYYATLCSPERIDPYIIIEGSRGRAIWDYKNNLETVIEGKSFKQKFGVEDTEVKTENIYRNLIKVLNGEETKPYCSITDTRNFILASNGAFESTGKIHNIPGEYIKRVEEGDSVATYVKDIEKIIPEAMEKGKLFSELDIEWAKQGKVFSLENYCEFKMFKD